MISKFMVCIFVTLIDNMSTFHILTDVIFLRSGIYQLKSIKVLSYSKIGLAPV